MVVSGLYANVKKKGEEREREREREEKRTISLQSA
jgi:hypothetical protein